jgi:outer membrane protein assembly factor BamB
LLPVARLPPAGKSVLLSLKVATMQVQRSWIGLFAVTMLVVNSAMQCCAVEPNQQFGGLGLEVKWQGQAVLNTSRDSVRHVVNDEDVIFVQSTAGVVTAFNAEDGRKRWAIQVGRNDEPAMAATTNHNLVLVIAGPVAYAMNKFTGDEVFKFRLPGQPAADPAMDENIFCVPMSEGAVHAFSIETLTHLERYGTLPPAVAKPFLWQFISNEICSHAPVINEDSVVFTTLSNNLHSVDLRGRSLYQVTMREPATAPMTAVSDELTDSVIVATGDNRLRSVVTTKPLVDWMFPLGRTIREQPVVIGDQVFAVTDGGGLMCISRSSGRPMIAELEDGSTREWFTSGIVKVVTVTQDKVYGVDVSDRLVVIKRTTGEVIARTSVQQFRHRHPNHLTDRVYLVSSSGQIMCLREPGSEFATYHQNPQKQPIAADVPDSDPVPAAENEGF